MSASTEDLEWLVPARNDIQSFLLELHRRRERSGLSPERSGQWQLLVGVAFSLWRAVFLLVDAPRARETAEEEAARFLRGVIETNAVTFSDDRSRRVWTSGYYVNNARLRMHELASRLQRAGPREGTSSSDEDLRQTWSELLGAAQAALDAVSPPERGGP